MAALQHVHWHGDLPAAERTGLGSLLPCCAAPLGYQPRLLEAVDSLLHYEVGGSLLVPVHGEEAVGETAEQTCIGNLRLYWLQLLVAMETLLHHKVGGGVLVPARGEAWLTSVAEGAWRFCFSGR